MTHVKYRERWHTMTKAQTIGNRLRMWSPMCGQMECDMVDRGCKGRSVACCGERP
jgi:hypothetical protein